MAEVQIGAETYFVYADVATANAYMEAAVGEAADAWRSADETAQGRALVSGTRAIDAQSWKGQKTVADQPGAFPRIGLFYPDGQAVPFDEVPLQVVTASIELAAMLNAGQPISPAAERQATAKRLKAGSVEIENFRQFGPVGIWPPTIMDLLGFWLANGRGLGVAGSVATGTCGRSAFRKPQYKPSGAW